MEVLRNDIGKPHLRLAARQRAVFDEPIEILRGHADNGLRMTVHHNGLSDDRGIAGEALFPKTVTKNRDSGVTYLVIFGSEAGTHDGVHAQHGKEVRGHTLRDDFLRVAGPGEVVALVEDRGHTLKGPILAAPVEKIGRGDDVAEIRWLGAGLPDQDEAAWIFVWQRGKETGNNSEKKGGI